MKFLTDIMERLEEGTHITTVPSVNGKPKVSYYKIGLTMWPTTLREKLISGERKPEDVSGKLWAFFVKHRETRKSS